MTVHNHGSEEGEGLVCPELRLPSGRIKGRCLLEEDVMRGDISVNDLRRVMGMSKKECRPIECQDKAKLLVREHIAKRYEAMPEYEVYVVLFMTVGLTWKAILETTLPNSGLYVVEYYTYEDKTTIRVYSKAEETTVY